MVRAATCPILLRDGKPDVELKRLSLGDLNYTEAWLQDLIARHPELLPVSEIEPAFERLIPAGREVACRQGFIDNLYLTEGGGIVVVETKLHANSQARREVVAQALDYLAALSDMTYIEFEKAVCRAQHAGPQPTSLFELVRGSPGALDECAFTDAVAANLARGRMLALVVGDGIRKEAETLASALQGHAGSHFTFALVELAIYQDGAENLLVVPSILLKTLMVERAVVRLEGQTRQITIEASTAAEAVTRSRGKGITELQFDELMDARKLGLSEAIHAFIASLEDLGVYPEMLGSLNLKAEVGRESPANLGYIQRNGQLKTDALGWKMPLEPTLRYARSLAALINGGVAYGPDGGTPYVTDGIRAPRIEDFIPANAEGWRAAIRELLRELRQA